MLLGMKKTADTWKRLGTIANGLAARLVAARDGILKLDPIEVLRPSARHAEALDRDCGKSGAAVGEDADAAPCSGCGGTRLQMPGTRDCSARNGVGPASWWRRPSVDLFEQSKQADETEIATAPGPTPCGRAARMLPIAHAQGGVRAHFHSAIHRESV